MGKSLRSNPCHYKNTAEGECGIQVSARYYPLVHDLLKEVTGATRVHIFDNTVRNGHIR